MLNLFKRKARPIDFNLKILIIADTHNCLMEEAFVGYNADVCLLLGDLSDEDLYLIKHNITNMPIYGILGNHYGQKLYEKYNIENIHGKVIEINGVKIAGFSGSYKYKETDAALYTDKESLEIAANIPEADILISHDSPKYLYGKDNPTHCGLKGITRYLEKNQIPLNIHGHYHRRQKTKLKNGTVVLACHNVEMVDTSKL